MIPAAQRALAAACIRRASSGAACAAATSAAASASASVSASSASALRMAAVAVPITRSTFWTARRAYSADASKPPAVDVLADNAVVAQPRADYSDGERIIHEKLANQLQATALNVTDISGGCGAMYAVEISSPNFRGMSMVNQHRLVTDILREDIKGMHGIQIKTKAS
ncbi:bola protein [Entophlyctis helioformis]|nr:bola protein [Entophlyctis helioformis]